MLKIKNHEILLNTHFYLIQILEDEIKQVLSGYTQEMLVLIETMSSNYLFNRLISDQIMKNNSSIKSMVEGMESGSIFEDLNNMSKFEKIILLQLRESEY